MEQKQSGKAINVGIEQYDYKGEPAISVTANGLDIGNLHKKDADYVLANKDRIIGFTDLFVDKFENEEGKTIYYARVELLVKNKTASNEKTTDTETSAPHSADTGRRDLSNSTTCQCKKTILQKLEILGYSRRGAGRHLHYCQHCRTDKTITYLTACKGEKAANEYMRFTQTMF